MNSVNNISRSQFEASLSAFRWRSWLLAAAVALLLNICLFLFLPVLMDPTEQKHNVDQIVNSIQLIHLYKKETPPQKKKLKPPVPPQEKPKPKPKVNSPKPVVSQKLDLPFKLNTRLPSVSADFRLQWENIRFTPPTNSSVDMNQLDEPLTVVARIPPVYPIRARRKGIEGWVRVGFEVDEKGYVDRPQIIESSPPGVFDKSVLKLVVKWRYKPGTVEGVAVRTKTQTTVRFELE